MWTETELLIRDDGLAAWRWEPDADPHVTDPNNATDGDILIAWALVEAAERFGETAYRAPAGRIADAIFDNVVETERLRSASFSPAPPAFAPRSSPTGRW